MLPLWATSRNRLSFDQIGTAGVGLDGNMRLIGCEPNGFTDLLEETGGLLHAKTFGDARAVILIDLVKRRSMLSLISYLQAPRDWQML